MENQSTHGGQRTGAGRKTGTKLSDKTEVFYKRVSPKEKELLEKFLNNIRQKRA